MIKLWLAQTGAVIRLEMKKTFFAKRGLWVYLLALAPAAIYFVHSMIEIRRADRLQSIAAEHPVSREALQAVVRGMSVAQVEQLLGQPYERNLFTVPVRPAFKGAGKKGGSGGFPLPPDGPPEIREIRLDRYTDGRVQYQIRFTDGIVDNVSRSGGHDLSEDTLVFATIFQFFYLRLAVFFGCVGVFMNLFRGEMLDKSLHFYLLAPLRREVLAAAKYLAGLIATATIFCASTALQLLTIYVHLHGPELDAYLAGPGWGHIAAYLGVTALACMGYGSVFLAAGMLVRNPIIPAAVVLLWEGANLFLPAALKKFSVIYYLQSLCPVVAPPGSDIPEPLRLLINAAEPVSAPVAILGLLAVTALVLAIAGRQARRLEINYGTE
jgi:ABC-type transport system involved in multi-copper enzyme maturation permease subunit